MSPAELRLADGACVHPVVSSTLVPSELPVTVTRRARPAGSTSMIIQNGCGFPPSSAS